MKKFSLIALALITAFISIITISCDKNHKITCYEIECSLSNENVLSGKEKVSFFNHTENAFSQLKFNIFGNAFREDAKYSPIAKEYVYSAYPNGLNYGDMQILSVTDGQESLEYSICGEDQNVLSINLQEEVFPEQTCFVEIEFKLSLANVIARTGANDKTINLANFYPILCGIDDNGFYECLYYSSGDPFFSDCANYKVTLTCDQEYVVACSGKLDNSSNQNGKTSSTYSIDNARSFAMVLSKEFECITDSSLGIEVNYYFYNDLEPIKSMEYALKSLKTFNGLFGQYPYQTYSVVQTKFVQGGMEFPAMVMISDGLEQKAYGEVIVHETAHQWWQSGVGNNEIEHGFLDEGLAEYSVVLFYENNPEYQHTRESLIKSSEQTYKIFCTVYEKLFGTTNTAMLRSLKDFNSEYEYVNIAYVKPCIMYDYLRSTIGDKKFFQALSNYYKNYCYKNASPEDLVGTFEKVGANSNGFFDSFFNGKVII